MYNRIVLNEPHASVEGLYDEKLSFWNIDARFLNDVVIKWTDWHTDFLFNNKKAYLRNDSICLKTDASYRNNLSEVIGLLVSKLLND